MLTVRAGSASTAAGNCTTLGVFFTVTGCTTNRERSADPSGIMILSS